MLKVKNAWLFTSIITKTSSGLITSNESKYSGNAHYIYTIYAIKYSTSLEALHFSKKLEVTFFCHTETGRNIDIPKTTTVFTVRKTFKQIKL
jgi:hypothetical protein